MCFFLCFGLFVDGDLFSLLIWCLLFGICFDMILVVLVVVCLRWLCWFILSCLSCCLVLGDCAALWCLLPYWWLMMLFSLYFDWFLLDLLFCVCVYGLLWLLLTRFSCSCCFNVSLLRCLVVILFIYVGFLWLVFCCCLWLFEWFLCLATVMICNSVD